MASGAEHGRMATSSDFPGDKLAVTADLIDPDQEDHGT